MPRTKTGVVTSELKTRTVLIDTDLSDKEFFFVNYDATDEDVVNIASGVTEFPFVIIEAEDGSSLAAADPEKKGTIVISGVTKIKLGGTVVSGDKITSDANGKGVATITDKDHVGGIVLENGVLDDIVAMSAVQMMVSAT